MKRWVWRGLLQWCLFACLLARGGRALAGRDGGTGGVRSGRAVVKTTLGVRNGGLQSHALSEADAQQSTWRGGNKGEPMPLDEQFMEQLKRRLTSPRTSSFSANGPCTVSDISHCFLQLQSSIAPCSEGDYTVEVCCGPYEEYEKCVGDVQSRCTDDEMKDMLAEISQEREKFCSAELLERELTKKCEATTYSCIQRPVSIPGCSDDTYNERLCCFNIQRIVHCLLPRKRCLVDEGQSYFCNTNLLSQLCRGCKSQLLDKCIDTVGRQMVNTCGAQPVNVDSCCSASVQFDKCINKLIPPCELQDKVLASYAQSVLLCDCRDGDNKCCKGGDKLRRSSPITSRTCVDTESRASLAEVESVEKSSCMLDSNDDEPSKIEPESSGNESAVQDGSSDEPACFPADATVELSDGSRKAMQDVGVGELVRVADGKYSPIYTWSHRDVLCLAKFLAFETEATSLAVTAGHYIVANQTLVAASHVQVGDLLTLSNGSQARIVRRNEIVLQGLYNPHTLQGTIVVNECLVSTYTTAVNPTMAHMLLAGPRLLFRLGFLDILGSLLCGWPFRALVESLYTIV
eukprot:Plantae.Rhodophyta-Purpureofilum_apyrenoidigerum.ctg154.p1 GENE.Plantae.Rhodophyta-Purpureofilum_apyrenoidigerum.ctg154~~Plantae.Rhodophyta-Purpureofilum_apyrenoidigerum.ctg154.p1  ORF type:complete len:573 (-),score=49.40 Plantae.Rhodophyta-Purpureofilum_apyrenoidigerum.ctg154:70-1788(-)